MHAAAIRVYLVAAAVSAAVLYGGSYQQFRFFDLAQPGGAADAVDYAAMARGDFPDPLTLHSYRWITPALARGVATLTPSVTNDPDLPLRLGFYVVNFCFSLLASMLLFATLRRLGFPVLLSLLGVCLFASSRVIVRATGTPLADAVFFCAIAALALLLVSGRPVLLACMLPVLALSKDIFLPFIFLPLLTELRRSTAIRAAIPIAAGVFPLNMFAMEQLSGHNGTPVLTSLSEHVVLLRDHAAYLLRPAGLADLHSAFSVTLALTVAGMWVTLQHPSPRLPKAFIAMLPIAAALVMLSGNAGRMLFAAFPAVIAYALIAVDSLAGAAPTQH